MADDWFRWMLGGLVAFYTGVTSWLILTIFSLSSKNADKHAEMDRRVSLMEAKVYIDPIAYATTMADLTNAIANLNDTVTDLRTQIVELEDLIREQKRGPVR